MKKKDKILLRVIPPVAAYLAKGIGVSMTRVDKVNQETEDKLLAENQGLIYAVWHSRMVIPILNNYEGRGDYALISQHKDGRYASKAVGFFHIKTIDGSSTRGGDRAFREMTRLIDQGKHIIITPDGPKGPKQKVKPGIIQLAQLTGAAILPISSSAVPAIRFKSWDEFMVPYPFSRGVLIWGKPLFPHKSKDFKVQEYYVRRLEDELNRITDLADNHFPPSRPNVPITIKNQESIQAPELGCTGLPTSLQKSGGHSQKREPKTWKEPPTEMG